MSATLLLTIQIENKPLLAEYEMQSSAFGIRKLVEDSIPERLIFGRSAAMQGIREVIERVADVSVPVLLQGERGTGKELIGREIHHRSRWREGPFVRVASRELRATSSHKQTKSAERENIALPWRTTRIPAEGSAGTLFFDEVSELNPALQATLLGLFRNDHSDRSSDEANCHTGSRIICATKRNLENEVAAGNFRSDLFYRINIVTIQLPKLRDRREDIPELVEYFFEVHCRRQNRYCQPVPVDVLRLFCEYQWPGNIRELENCIRRYVNTNGELAAIRLPGSSSRTRTQVPDAKCSDPIPLKTYRRQVVEQAEKDMILRVLGEQRWNRKEAARVLQVSYNTLLQKLKQTGLDKKTKPATTNASKQIPAERMS